MPNALKREWAPRPIWRRSAAFVLGGGPSLAGFDPNCLVNKRIIVVNSSYRLAPITGAILFFGDYDWADDRPDVIEAWRWPIVTTSTIAKDRWPRIRLARRMPEGPEAFLGGSVIIDGESSGHSAVSLAAALGADPIILLGFDQQNVNGRSNWHDDYGFVTPDVCYEAFRNHFEGWHALATAAGIRILNATPGSALEEFDRISLEDFLGG